MFVKRNTFAEEINQSGNASEISFGRFQYRRGGDKLLFSELYRIIRIARLSSHLFIVSEYMNREMKYLMGLTFFPATSLTYALRDKYA